MTTNKKLRQKALMRAKVLRLFKKFYWLYGALALISFFGTVIAHEWMLAVLFLFSVCFAIISVFVHVMFMENIESNKPLTKKQRKRTVFILDIVKEISYFEVQYLKPGITWKELNYSN